MDTLTLAKQPGDGKRYAIIFGAGTEEAHFNMAKQLYWSLTNEYGYSDSDIALLWCDGNHSYHSKWWADDGMTLVGEKKGATWSKIDKAATKANLWAILKDMGSGSGGYQKIGTNDRLLVCFMGHGGSASGNTSTLIKTTMENFEVKNLTGKTANDFHVVLTNVQPSDIKGYFGGGWGSGTATALSPDTTGPYKGKPKTEIEWTGSANCEDWVHFGVKWNGSVFPLNYEAWWTKNGKELMSLDISKAPTWWQPQAGLMTRAVIVNLHDQPLMIREVKWAVVDGFIELDDLTWGFEPPGGWKLYDAGQNVVLQPTDREEPEVGNLVVQLDEFAYTGSREYSILLRYSVETVEGEGGVWRNVTACHVEPVETDPISTSHVAENVYDKLVDWHPDGFVVPQLLEGWEVSEDGLVVTLHIREGVYANHEECPAL